MDVRSLDADGGGVTICEVSTRIIKKLKNPMIVFDLKGENHVKSN
jgi:hypothetical protein